MGDTIGNDHFDAIVIGEIPYEVRETQRWSDFDFEGPARDGYATDWPIRYKDLASWYSYVEKFVGISGNKDGLPQLPDGEFLPPLELTCVETYFADLIRKTTGSRIERQTAGGPLIMPGVSIVYSFIQLP